MDLPKRPVGSHSNIYLPSYTVCSCSVLNMIDHYTTEMAQDKASANSESLRETANSLAHLIHDMNADGLHTYLM